VIRGSLVRLPRQWVFTPSGAWAMKRLNLTYFLELGAAITPLADYPKLTDGDPAPASFRADLGQMRRVLLVLVKHDAIPLAIPASRPAAQKLLNHIDLLLKKEKPVVGDMWDIYWMADPLRTLLHGELAVQSVYHIWPKRAFDTNLMIDKATALFSSEIQVWFTPEETYNIEQAGKCIAFETPTAAGFHLIRAAESVIRRYYTLVVGTEPKLKMRNWGVYIRNLKKCGAEPKVIHALEQIKDLHRNPVIHPEIALTLEEAVSLIGITESVISAIFADMKQRGIANQAKVNALTSVLRGTGTYSALAAMGTSDDEIPF
jgi:hypothetical protein